MVGDDPESFADLDGHFKPGPELMQTLVDFSTGLENALLSDNVAGIGRQDQDTTAGKIGAVVGDTIATVQGVVEASAGGTAALGGGAACATGVGCVAGAPAVAVGAVAAVHGTTTALEGGGHLLATAAKMLEGAGASKVDKVVDTIDKGGFQVNANPKSAGQEGNVTITHPSEPGRKVNVRVETHPLEPGGKPVRHANVERVVPGAKNRPVAVSNEHITE